MLSNKVNEYQCHVNSPYSMTELLTNKTLITETWLHLPIITLLLILKFILLFLRLLGFSRVGYVSIAVSQTPLETMESAVFCKSAMASFILRWYT